MSCLHRTFTLSHSRWHSITLGVSTRLTPVPRVRFDCPIVRYVSEGCRMPTMDFDHAGATADARDSPGQELLQNPSDTLSEVLEVVRLTGALFFLVDARTPWVAEAPASTHLAPVILPRAQHVVSYHVIAEGTCWCESPGHAPVRLETGDVLVVPHGQPYQLATACGLRYWVGTERRARVVSGDGQGEYSRSSSPRAGMGPSAFSSSAAFSAVMHSRSTRF